MLFMLLLNSVQSLTVLTFCAQWMVLAALLMSCPGFRTLFQLCDAATPAPAGKTIPAMHIVFAL